jgi:Alpha-tubulin suppressor and related RCC1 domain-containing proteins
MKKIFLLVISFCFITSTIAQSCWKMLADGNQHTLAIRADGTLWSWGQNNVGQLGDASGFSTDVPVQIGTLKTWIKVYAAVDNSFAIKADGTLWAWGGNAEGTLGDGTNVIRNTPIQIGTGTDWETIIPSYTFTCALKKDGSLWTWGNNWNGQLGNGTKVNNNSPSQVGSDKNWKFISAGLAHVLAIKVDGTLWSWGNNYRNALGYDSSGDILIPTKAGTNTNWKMVAAGYNHSLGIQTDGTLWAWGSNNEGQIGNNKATNYELQPIQVGNNTNWDKIYAIQNWCVGLKTDGTIWSWGSGAGYFNSASTFNLVPTQFGVDSDWQSIWPNNEQSVALKDDGTLWAWGSNTKGELGLGVYGNTYIPYLVSCIEPIKSSCWKNIKASGYAVICMRTDSTLWGWGSYSSSPYNDSHARNSILPTRIGRHKWRSIDMNAGLAIGIRSDGTLWQFWGRGLPTQLSAETDWVFVAAGDKSYAIKDDGSLWTWVSDMTSLIDNIIPVPVQLGTEKNWQCVAASKTRAAGIRTDGSLWIWGAGMYGSMGMGIATSSSTTPLQLGSDFDWASISLSMTATMALKQDGTLWACGRNEYGQIGDGTFTDRYILTKIGTDSDWQTVVAGPFHTLAFKEDGTMHGWGSSTLNKLSLVAQYDWQGLPINNNWQSAAASEYNSFAINADGFLYTIGNNDYSQIGAGDYRVWNVPFALRCLVLTTDPTDPVTTGLDMQTIAGSKKLVYPNPNDGSFILAGNVGSNLIIYNVQGKIVKSTLIKNSNEYIQTDLEQGIYYYVLQNTDGSNDAGKFIVQ